VDRSRTVQDIYAAFGRGDIEGILAHLGDDVAWEPGTVDHGVPWLAPGSGRDHVRRFFQTVTEQLEFRAFRPTELLEGDQRVAAVVDVEVVVRATGVTIRDQEVHLWTLDDDGRVAALRHVVDTHQHVAALHGAVGG
jgi:ketosteroid isomerase-like protein